MTTEIYEVRNLVERLDRLSDRIDQLEKSLNLLMVALAGWVRQ